MKLCQYKVSLTSELPRMDIMCQKLHIHIDNDTVFVGAILFKCRQLQFEVEQPTIKGNTFTAYTITVRP